MIATHLWLSEFASASKRIRPTPLKIKRLATTVATIPPRPSFRHHAPPHQRVVIRHKHRHTPTAGHLKRTAYVVIVFVVGFVFVFVIVVVFVVIVTSVVEQ
jgi:hypothetical protein